MGNFANNSGCDHSFSLDSFIYLLIFTPNSSSSDAPDEKLNLFLPLRSYVRLGAEWSFLCKNKNLGSYLGCVNRDRWLPWIDGVALIFCQIGPLSVAKKQILVQPPMRPWICVMSGWVIRSCVSSAYSNYVLSFVFTCGVSFSFFLPMCWHGIYHLGGCTRVSWHGYVGVLCPCKNKWQSLAPENALIKNLIVPTDSLLDNWFWGWLEQWDRHRENAPSFRCKLLVIHMFSLRLRRDSWYSVTLIISDSVS